MRTEDRLDTRAETAMEAHVWRFRQDPTFHHLVNRLVTARSPEEVLGFLAAGQIAGDMHLNHEARELLERHELVLGLTDEGEFGLWKRGEDGPLGRGDTVRNAVLAASIADHVRGIQTSAGTEP